MIPSPSGPIAKSNNDDSPMQNEAIEHPSSIDPRIQHASLLTAAHHELNTPLHHDDQDLFHVENDSNLSDPEIPEEISPRNLDTKAKLLKNAQEEEPGAVEHELLDQKFFPKENPLNAVRKLRREKHTNIISRWTFFYLEGYVWKHNKHLVTESTVHRAEPEDEAALNFEKLKFYLDKYDGNLYKALARIHWKEFVFSYILRLINDLMQYPGPLLLHEMVVFLKDSQKEGVEAPSIWWGVLYAFLLLVTSILQSVFLHQYFTWMHHTFLGISSSLQCQIYRKSLKLSPEVHAKYSSGQIVNMLSIDVEAVANGFCYWSWHTFGVPISLSISLFLTYTILGWPVFAGILLLLILLPLDALIGRWVGKYARKVLKTKDTRSSLMSGIISGIRIIKFYGWEYPFRDLVLKVRKEEYRRLRSYSLLIAFQQFFSATIPIVTSLATFGVYFLVGGDLSPEKLFTALSLITSLRLQIRIVPEFFTEMIKSFVSLRRVSDFLKCKEIENMPHLPKEVLEREVDAHIDGDDVMETEFGAHQEDNSNLPRDTMIRFSNASCSWTSTQEEPTLKNINLDFKRGSLVSVIGPVSSGKTSLIHSIFGECELIEGDIIVKEGASIALCTQNAWVPNTTFRENITMNMEYNEAKYQRVIDTCALRHDLESLPAGSETEIGAGACNLSGGQRARLSLARAVYRDADIVLLDSPLSALDAHVASSIYEQCIMDLLKDKTVILVTHSLHLLHQSDSIIVMDEGRVKMHGSFDHLMQNNDDFASMMRGYIDDVALQPQSRDEPLTPLSPNSKKGHTDANSFPTLPTTKSALEDATTEATAHNVTVVLQRGKLTTKESLFRGVVKLSVYKNYILGFTIPFLLIILVCGVLSKVFETAMDAWMAKFQEATSTQQVLIYLGIYSAFATVASVLFFLLSMSFFIGSLWSSSKMHDRLLDRLLHAPTRFYDQTPDGQILNRLTNDQQKLDQLLPNDTFQTYQQLLIIVSVLGVILYSSAYFLLLIPPILVAFYIMQRIYRTVSRELSRLLNNSKSPMFSTVSTSIEGASTIRAHNYIKEFCLKNDLLVSEYNNLLLELCLVNRWIGVRLETMSAFIIFIAALLAVVLRGSMSPAVAGLTLTYSLTVTRGFYRVVRYYAAMERSLVSVERMQEFSNIEIEAPFEYDTPRAPGLWPSSGKIEFVHVKMRYRKDLDYSLKDVNITLEPGRRTGIVGRTASGKSSLIQCLFRGVELASGKILVDDVDISTLGLHELRSKIAIVPQNPFIFDGSVRFNLDPFSEHSDDKLWEVLRKVRLKESVENMSGQLEFHLEDGGANISSGQRQLFCIARVLLRDCQIIVADEATSSLDHESDSLIQEVLREVFRGKTMLLIAHRLHTIMDADRILVMQDGKNIEYGSPSELLTKPHSAFSRLVNELSTATTTALAQSSI